MSVLLSPDCLDTNHRACSGNGWCEQSENVAPCPCSCHRPAQPARPTTHAMHARHLSGASIGKLVEWEVGQDLTTGAHQWSPPALLEAIHHSSYELTIYCGHNETELPPDSWVRVTQGAP